MNELQTSMPSGYSLNLNNSTELRNEELNMETSQAVERNEKAASSALQSENTSAVKNKSELTKEIKENLEKLNQFIPVTSTNLSFEFDEQGEPPVVKVIDSNNEEVIREIPSEEFREMAKALEEFADKVVGKGVLFDKTA